MKEPTAVKSWTRLFPNFAHSWKQISNTIYKTTTDNKLREFGFKFLHRILVTNKELKRFKIRNDGIWAQCKNSDSMEHTFLECPINVKFITKSYRGSMQSIEGYKFVNWAISISELPLSFFKTATLDPTRATRLAKKKYLYSCKSSKINPGCSQFLNKLKIQWKIKISS